MTGRWDIMRDLAALAEMEREAVGQEVLAPVCGPQAAVAVRLAGIAVELALPARVAAGWYIVRPLSLHRAEVVRPATPQEVGDYLEIMKPAAPVVLAVAAEESGTWYAVPTDVPLGRPGMGGDWPPLVLVRLAFNVRPFQRAFVRRCGERLYFWHILPARGAVAREMEAALEAGGPLPDVKGADPADYAALALLRQNRVAVAAAEQEKRVRRVAAAVPERLRAALERFGGTLLGYVERADAYVVSYMVDGVEAPPVAVAKTDLQVLSPGICLAGQHARFDLTSMVSVMREGRRSRRIVVTGLHELEREDEDDGEDGDDE